jgi:hypothetical protein
MATLSAINPTLLDVIKATDPDGSISVVAEILNETNEILDDMTMMEGNLATGHRTTVRTGLPEPTWRMLYGGVQPTKSTRATVTDSCGMLEAYAEIDKALADLNGNTNAFRLQEDRAHIEGMSQTVADTIFQGDETLTPERFTGFNARFGDLSGPANAENIIDAAGTGSDNASIWLIGWGPSTVHGIYPKGSKAGLHMEDKGQVTIENIDGSNGRMEAYRTHYRWDLGLTVRDWRYVVRIANIDRSALTADAATGANLPDLMFEATERVPSLSGARFAFYMDRSVRTKLRQQTAAAVSGSTLTTDMVGGKRVVAFDGIPVKRVDALKVDEARVV